VKLLPEFSEIYKEAEVQSDKLSDLTPESAQDRIRRYIDDGGHRAIEGAAGDSTLRRIVEVNQLQLRLGLRGNLVEIGVAHGKLLILLGLLAQPDEFSLAVDVFDEHDKNYDLTGGSTTLSIVQENFAIFVGDLEICGFKYICGDSLFLDSNQMKDVLGTGGARIFSIDGAHSHFHTVHDMRLAEQLLVPGGVVLVDDITNSGWPGVMEGVARYFLLSSEVRLVPFLMADNKLWLTTYDRHQHYFEYALHDSHLEHWQLKRVTKFFGHDIVGF
jgi:SAM-dependent methyltransferase